MDVKTLVSQPADNGQRATPTFLYTAFGLSVSSCIQCPELRPGAGTPDVTVVYGDVSQDLPGAIPIAQTGCQALPGQLLMDVEGVARFLIRNGNEIVIDRKPESSDDDVRLFLLGSGFGGLMHQRGMLVMHGSSVEVDDGCVVFLGRSGVGKSTLATELSRRGYACLGDDVCAISIGEDGVPYASPAYPQAKLCVDSVEYFGLDPEHLRRIRPSREKRAVPLTAYSQEDRLPVKAMYVLTRGKSHVKEVYFRRITGPVKMRVLRDFTYRGGFLQGLDLAPQHFKQIAHIAARLPVTYLVRPRQDFAVEQLASAVEESFASYARSTPAAAAP